MGHVAGKDIYQRLGAKLDRLTCRAPWSDTFHQILRELYSEEEADCLVRMPSGASTMAALVRSTGLEASKLPGLIDRMCRKGLVVDLSVEGIAYYMPAPVVIGLFEFAMMRTEGLEAEKLSRLFHHYLEDDGAFHHANLGTGQRVSVMRSLPHEGTVREDVSVEVLDYEKASKLVSGAEKISLSICSCRHKARHLGEAECSAGLDVCTSMGYAADFLIRRGLGREASKAEALDALARSREQGLVLNADNVQRNATFICHCCKCCCMALRGISRSGYPNAVMTSSFIAEVDHAACEACGACVEACPISVIAPATGTDDASGVPVIDRDVCLGCGVCAVKCPAKAVRLVPREPKVIHPETTFRKIILASLENGTLQDQLFGDPSSMGQGFLRALVGAFLGLGPVQRALMSRTLRSSFLRGLEAGARLKGDGWMTEL